MLKVTVNLFVKLKYNFEFVDVIVQKSVRLRWRYFASSTLRRLLLKFL